MKEYKNILFDLDGTLTDSSVGITKSVAHTLERFGIQPPPIEELTDFIGPPLAESFEKHYGIDPKNIILIEKFFREYYNDFGIYENKVYDGIPELLAYLKADGRFLAVATSKPDFQAEKVLNHFNLTGYFNTVVGADVEAGFVNKGDIIERLITDNRLAPEETLMIGDRFHDIIGAHRHNIDVLYALWGFGNADEAKDYNAEYAAKTVQNALGLFKNK